MSERVCELCLASAEGAECPSCGAEFEGGMYRFGQVLPPLAFGFGVSAVARVAVSFSPEPGLVGTGVALAGAVGVVTAVHAVGDPEWKRRAAVGLLTALVLVGLFAAEQSLGAGLAGEELVGALTTFGGGALAGLVVGWPLSMGLRQLPPFLQINELTERLPEPRARLLVRTLLHGVVIAALIALAVALAALAIALFVAWIVLAMAWGMIQAMLYEAFGIGMDPEEKARRKAIRKAEEEAEALRRQQQNTVARQAALGGLGKVRDADFREAGRMMEDGRILDENFREIGRVTDDGRVLDENFREIGRVLDDGRVVDENWKDRGRILDSGEIVDEDWKVRARKLDE